MSLALEPMAKDSISFDLKCDISERLLHSVLLALLCEL